MNEQETIEAIYEQAYRDGYTDARHRTPLLGTADLDPGDIECPLDADDWELRPRADFDTDNVVYVEVDHNTYSDISRTERFMHYLDFDANTYGHGSRQIMEERRLPPRVDIDITEDPADYIQQLKDRIKELIKENDALHATHPAAGCEWSEDPKDLSPDAEVEWSLEPQMLRTESKVPLSGSHVFDHAVVEYDVNLTATSVDHGTVNTHVDIENIELVSTN